MNRVGKKARDFAYNYGHKFRDLRTGKDVTEAEALEMVERYHKAYPSGGGESPTFQAHSYRQLRWARLVFIAQVALALLGFSILLKAVGAVVAAFTPGGGHGF